MKGLISFCTIFIAIMALVIYSKINNVGEITLRPQPRTEIVAFDPIDLESFTGSYQSIVETKDSVFVGNIIIKYIDNEGINFVWKTYDIPLSILVDQEDSILVQYDAHGIWVSGALFFYSYTVKGGWLEIHLMNEIKEREVIKFKFIDKN